MNKTISIAYLATTLQPTLTECESSLPIGMDKPFTVGAQDNLGSSLVMTQSSIKKISEAITPISSTYKILTSVKEL